MDLMERPCIHVSLLTGADASLFRWVEIGAEEEGVPTRLVPCDAGDLVTLAYQTAHSSRLSVGVGISAQAVVLHEQHMPVGQPVLAFEFVENAPYLCRLMGANAARMVVHRPLQVDINPPAPVASRRPAPAVLQPAVLQPPVEKNEPAAEPQIDPAQLAQIVAAVVRKLQQRGI